ncbi:Retrovirus-related Pol Polyprotein from transposon 412 [Phytophthora megakarya]|uniref:Retrovirus-related Pol Polyprotein from transposon 412 n=1 Tax=Phytophthora megakarya TaxID=4795 RepID=A0A225W702_9STRA|nr:Retrovirus-related Pol Polyprotein from transposon 412 [Phytophthora megakarya]
MTPGRTDLLEFSIDTGSSPPTKQRPYRVSKAEGDVMEAELQQYLSLGHIRPSTSPWASPVLMIRKPDCGIRFCIDYRRLNAITVKDCYPMPLIDAILDVLGNAKLFSTMDMTSGYWNVQMAKNSVEKTAFTYKYGLYEWLVMPFGLCNAVPAFESLMENVLVDLKWRTCLVYLDDCVVFSHDFPTHLIRLKQVLERFRMAGFKLKMKKCKWGRDQVAFLGHIVTPSGILPNPEKVKAVINVKRPHDLHTVRAFLGLTSYFRRYIPGYAGISAPIERLKQLKGAAFVWSDDWEPAFLQLKRRLIEPPILIYPDFSKRFKLYVDSSKLAVGACLMQTVGGRDRVVAYASKLLVGSEKNWIRKVDGTSEIECWGIVWATRKFRCYLDRQEFDLYTDHKALTWVFNENNRTNLLHDSDPDEVDHVLTNDLNPGDDGQVQVREPSLLMRDLMNEADLDDGNSVQVRESGTLVDGNSGMIPAPGLLEVREHQSVVDLPDSVPLSEHGALRHPAAPSVRVSEEVVEPLVSSPVDEFGLDMLRFVEEQKRTPP